MEGADARELSEVIDGAERENESQRTHDERWDRSHGEIALSDEAIEGVLVSITQAAAPSTAGAYPRAGLRPDPGVGPPPPRFARGRNLHRRGFVRRGFCNRM